MRHLRSRTIQALIILEAAKFSFGLPVSPDLDVTNNADTSISTIEAQPRGMADDHDLEPKSKPWLGYYDFLITEGSYKFWVVFELFTCALLIYSAFAALYYAKYTNTDYDYDEDYFFKKRSSRSIPQPPSEMTFLGLSPQAYLRILDAITVLNERYSAQAKYK